jgi:transposase, IS5 family
MGCISKGRAHKRYECRVKVGVVGQSQKTAHPEGHSLRGRPYDRHTLTRSLVQASLNIGIQEKAASEAKGY